MKALLSIAFVCLVAAPAHAAFSSKKRMDLARAGKNLKIEDKAAKIKRHKLQTKQQAPTQPVQKCADFSGNWVGTCSFKGQQQFEIESEIYIEQFSCNDMYLITPETLQIIELPSMGTSGSASNAQRSASIETINWNGDFSRLEEKSVEVYLGDDQFYSVTQMNTFVYLEGGKLIINSSETQSGDNLLCTHTNQNSQQ